MEEIIASYGSYVGAVIGQIGGKQLTAEDREDLAADVWMKFWEISGTLQIEEVKIKAYLGAMARHRTLNLLRKRGVYEWLPVEQEQVDVRTPEMAYLDQEERKILEEVLGTLDEVDREIFVRRYFHFERVGEIAKALGMNRQTVGSKLCRGKEKLAKGLQERRLYRMIMIGVACMTLVGVTVGALSLGSVLVRYFEGQEGLVQENSQSIGKAVTTEGITMEVDTALASGNGGIIVFRLYREDGQPFEEGTVLKKLKIEMPSSHAYSKGCLLSEDGKTLTYMINVKGDEKMRPGVTTVTGEDLVIPTFHRDPLAIDLSQVSGPVPLEHPESDITLEKVYQEGGKLCIAFTRTYREQALWQLIQLVDTRTGKLVDSGGATEVYTDSASGRGPTKAINYYEDITAADLPYLQLANIYNTYDLVAAGEWQVAFRLSPNPNVKRTKKKYKIETEKGLVTLSEVEISVVGGLVRGMEPVGEQGRPIEAHQELDFELQLKDGKRQKLYGTFTTSGGGDTNSEFSISLEPIKNWLSYTEEERIAMRDENLLNPLATELATEILPERLIELGEVEGIWINNQYIQFK
ncbi:MAG: sigma-70 family RNA polymerase sigma factor [Cellulosilyticaceae bacterium]